MKKFLSVLLLAFFGMSASATSRIPCVGVPHKGQVVVTKIPYRGVIVRHAPISKAKSRELANSTMGGVYEMGDTSPVAMPPSRVATRDIARSVAERLHICIRSVR